MLLHVSPSPLSLHVPCVSPSPSSSRSGLRIPSPPPLPPPPPPSRQGRWLSTTRSSHYDGRGSKGRTTPPFYEEEEEEEEDGAGAEEAEDGEEENSIAMATSIQAYPSSNSNSSNSRISSSSSGGGGRISSSSSGDSSSGGGRISSSSSSASASRRALLIGGVLGFGALSLSPPPFSAVLSSLKEGAVATESAIKEGSGAGAAVKDGGGAAGKDVAPAVAVAKEEGKRKEVFRVYDSTALGEPVPIGKDKGRVWQKLLAARVVYLGESERVPDPDDKVLELDILQTLRDKCFEQQRPVSLAMQAIPCNLQTQLNQYASKRITDEQLRASLHHWSDGRWTEYLPILHYCRNNGVRLMACGTPLEVLRTVQAKGLQGISDAESRKYVPPAGGNNINYSLTMQQLSLEDVLPNVSVPFGPGPYNFAQARMVEDYTMSQVVLQATADGGVVGLLIVIVGASHVVYGSKGSGLPARISKRLQKKTQAVVLLNPERQRIRREGDVAEADFLWYSAAKPCVRNCFDRAEVARVMDAAGRRRDALPQDLQTGLDLGLVPPEVLESFLNLEKQPFIADLTNRFQGVRERWLADPRFLQRLAIEESISITTTLIAQYERRKGRFFEELDYVITDTVRGAVVDFFTVWLPAPTLSFRSPTETAEAANNILGSLAGLQSILGSFPDNAFQRATRGENWGIKARIGSVIVGGLKLFFVGFVSSVGTLAISNTLLDVRQRWNSRTLKPRNKRSPVLKTAFVYGSFLGTSANLRYQAIAGLVEHWVADFFFESHPLAGSVLSFAARTLNSYFGTQQWVDLARLTGLQGHGKEEKENVVMKNASSENTGGDGLEATTPATDSKESFDNNASWNLPPPPIEQVMKGTEHMVGTHLQNKDSDK